MDDTSKTLRRWVAFAGCVLVVVILYWAQTVLVPIALAILLTFVLSPPVTWLERWIGRIPAVLAMVALVFTVLGLAGWGLARQMDHLAEDLPRYRVNILAKIADVRGAGKGDRSRSSRTRSKTSRLTSENPRYPEERSRDPSSSPRSRSRVSPASRGSVQSSVRSAPRGSCWRWSSSCCSSVGICAIG
jgi:AI-2E family transporter